MSINVIDNVKIYTCDDSLGVIERGRVTFDGGKIIGVEAIPAVGEPSGILFPGFIDAHTHIGLIEDSLGVEGCDVNETGGDAITPQLRAVDAINPLERSFSEARLGGVTTVFAGPGSANPIGGTFCALKTVGRRVDDMLLGVEAMKFALGENPKMVYHGKSQSPETRMATAAMIRETLYKAKKYSDDMAAANAEPTSDEDDIPDEPDYDIKNDALIPVVRGEMASHFHAHRADDIFTAIRIAKEFDLRYTIVHCTEGHLVADILAGEANFSAIVGPSMGDRSKPELLNKSFDTPKSLDDAGILTAITTDHPETPLYYLPLCAMLAVQTGLDFERAIRMITINPAKILGIDARVGSITVGKDADLVLYDRLPTDITAKVKQVYIDGKIVTE